MSESLTDRRVTRLIKLIESHCKRLNLMEGDFGKAVNRIKVKGFGANLEGLALDVEKDASAELELIAMAFAAFKRAAKIATGHNRYQTLVSTGA